MTKREEVDRILTRHTGCTDIHLDVVKRELSDAGVVIKVERELPAVRDRVAQLIYHYKWNIPLSHVKGGWKHMLPWQQSSYLEKADELLREAGYEAVEPLIGEK